MARLPETQLFACPACAKLYKRKVDVWIDMRYPRAPASPSASIPRVCNCGRVFLLSEATVIAQLDRSRPNPDALNEFGMDRVDIPAFLRKQAIGDDTEPTPEPPAPKPVVAPTLRKRPGPFARLWVRLCNALGVDGTEAQRRAAKGNPMQEVLWDMEASALPERIAPEGSVPGTFIAAAESGEPPTR